MALIHGGMCATCPLREPRPEPSRERVACAHEFEIELVGGTLLTNHYVCRLCGHRVQMADGEMGHCSTYPRHYQVPERPAESDEATEPAGVARSASNGQRDLRDQAPRSLAQLMESKDLMGRLELLNRQASKWHRLRKPRPSPR
jgi:hypothetical protein